MPASTKPRYIDVVGGYPFPKIRVEHGVPAPERIPFKTGALVLVRDRYEWFPA